MKLLKAFGKALVFIGGFIGVLTISTLLVYISAAACLVFLLLLLVGALTALFYMGSNT